MICNQQCFCAQILCLPGHVCIRTAKAFTIKARAKAGGRVVLIVNSCTDCRDHSHMGFSSFWLSQGNSARLLVVKAYAYMHLGKAVPYCCFSEQQ